MVHGVFPDLGPLRGMDGKSTRCGSALLPDWKRHRRSRPVVAVSSSEQVTHRLGLGIPVGALRARRAGRIFGGVL